MNKKQLLTITILLGVIILGMGVWLLILVNQPPTIKVVTRDAPPIAKTEVQISNCSVYKDGERVVTYRAFLNGAPIKESETYEEGQQPVHPEVVCQNAGSVNVVDTELEALSAFASVEPGSPAEAPEPVTPGNCAGIGCEAPALLETVTGGAGPATAAAAVVSPATGSVDESEAVEATADAPAASTPIVENSVQSATEVQGSFSLGFTGESARVLVVWRATYQASSSSWVCAYPGGGVRTDYATVSTPDECVNAYVAEAIALRQGAN